MFKISFCNIYKFYEFKIENEENFYKSFLFIYRNDQEKLNKLGIVFDKNLNNLILGLNNKKIDFILLLYDGKNAIHSSGVAINKSVDRFFYEFQKNNYGVIGPTFTNPSYRKKGFYKLALKLQILNLINNYNIKDIYISTSKSNKTVKAFTYNNLREFSSGVEISIFNKLFINIIYKKIFKIRIFINQKLILKFK